MTARSIARSRGGGPLFTLAWFAVVLAVTFTTAFWIGQLVGPDAAGTERAPVTPHAPVEGH
jgi:hypothetical protein